MGLLSEGSPLSWEETKRWANHVRKHGILQFIHQYNKLKDRSNDCLKWGDEVEYMLVRFDHKEERTQLMMNAGEILEKVQQQEEATPHDHPTTWRPEYAAYMIEGTPGKPYGHRVAHLNLVEANMKLRREEVLRHLKGPGETAMCLTTFPRLGCPGFTYPEIRPTPQEGASKSLFFPDEAIFQGHPRFSTLTRNIRQRKGEKVAINIPIYRDVQTPKPFIEDLRQYGDDGESARASIPDHIYMDCMGFGMGCSCLQMTFQACSIREARFLYDQLAPLCPIVLALSAACPIHRGYLSDIDCRWNIIAASVDCRTKGERGIEPLKDEKYVIPKSRYDSIDSYLSPCAEKYNDISLVQDQEIYKQLRNEGIDHLLAQHIAHLFIRDPISLFSEKINQDDTTDTDHFENIQSTNWQTMRFKPPPPNSSIGWRVEFRPTEVQLTDFENAAFVVFVVLMTRVILSYKLNLVIPISKVDENMRIAQRRDAVLNEKFYFRKDIMTCQSPREAEEICNCTKPESDEDFEAEYTLMTVNEIINGKPGEFPGLVPLFNHYLDSVDDCDVDTRCSIMQYISLIKQRASGELKTTARWIRDFVTNHSEYKNDSVVGEKIQYDLLMTADKISNGEVDCPELLIKHNTKSQGQIPEAMRKAETYLDGMAKRHTLNEQNGEIFDNC